jgi:hypothetical protein
VPGSARLGVGLVGIGRGGGGGLFGSTSQVEKYMLLTAQIYGGWQSVGPE